MALLPPRWVETRFQKKNAAGAKLCKVCTLPVPKRRSSYCSDECYLRNTPQMIRAAVFRRDKGICALCHKDCEAFRALNKKLEGELREFAWLKDRSFYWMFYHAKENLNKTLRGQEPYEWQADHIIPVAEGGGLCGLDGYRSLCNFCHSRVSGQLRKRLNLKRKLEQQNRRKNMTETEFRALVNQMRIAQKSYFRLKTTFWLEQAKSLERQVDLALKPQEPNLFDQEKPPETAPPITSL